MSQLAWDAKHLVAAEVSQPVNDVLDHGRVGSLQTAFQDAQARVSLADRGMQAGLRSAALQTLAERLIPAEELKQRVRDQLSAPHRTTRTCTLVAIVASASASSQRPTIASRGMLRGC